MEINAAANAIEQLAPTLANGIRTERERLRGASETMLAKIYEDSTTLFANPQVSMNKSKPGK